MRFRIAFIFTALILFQFISLSNAQGADSCPSALAHALVDTDYGLVTGDGLRMRDNPSLQANLILNLEEGQVFTVIGGPNCADDYTWWQISVNDVTGWLVQGSATEYWVEAFNASCPPDLILSFEEGDRIHAVDTNRVNLRDDSSLDGAVLGQMTASDIAIVMDSAPVCNENDVWWFVDLDGLEAWILESTGENQPLVQTHRFHDITPALPASFTAPIAYSISSNGERFAVAKADVDEIYIFDSANPLEAIFVSPDEPLQFRYHFALSSDGNILAIQLLDETILWDVDQGTEITSLSVAYNPALRMIRHDEGLLGNFYEDSLTLLSSSDYSPIWALDSTQGNIDTFDWHQESNQVVAISDERPQEIYLANIGTEEITLLESLSPENDINCVRFHPSGTSILLAQFEGHIAQIFLDEAQESRVIDLDISRNPTNYACAVSNDGRYFAVQYWNSIYVWDLESNETLLLDGHTSGTQVNQLQFSEDDKQLFSTTANGEILAWDMIQVLKESESD